MKTSKKFRRIISLFCALLMVVTILPVQPVKVAKAAATKYESCLYAPEQGQKHASVINKEDVCSQTITLARTQKLTMNGWVLSTTQINYYQIYFVRENDPAPKRQDRITASTWDFSKDTNVGGVGSGFYQYISANKYVSKNSKWEYVLDSTWMLPGAWTVFVYGYLTGNNAEIKVAKIKLQVEPTIHVYTNGGSPMYIACNDEPNPAASKKQTKKGPSIVNLTQTFKVGPVSGATTSIPVHGWVLHEDGVQSYSYEILNSSGVPCGSGTFSTYPRPDLEAVSKKKNLMTWGLDTAGYIGRIDISGLHSGKFTAVITGKTLDGAIFSVAKITFDVVRYYKVTCQYDEYDDGKKVSKVVVEGTKLDLDKTFGDNILIQYGFYPSWTSNQNNLFKPCTKTITVTRDVTIDFVDSPNSCKATFLNEDGSTLKTVKLSSGKQSFDSVCKAPASKDENMVFVGWLLQNDPKNEKNAAGKDTYRFLYLPQDSCVVDDGVDKVYKPLYVKKGLSDNCDVTLSVSQLIWLKSQAIGACDGLIEDPLPSGANKALAAGLSIAGILLPFAGTGFVAIGTVFAIAGIGITFFDNGVDCEAVYTQEQMKTYVERLSGYIQRAIGQHSTLISLDTTISVDEDGKVKYTLNSAKNYY